MDLKIIDLENFDNIDEVIDSSYNGTCFAYSWFLKLKKCNTILCIYEENKMIAFMPLFNNSENFIKQSTMYIPYGGFVLIDVPKEERNKIRFIRNIEKVLIDYFNKKYDSVDFSLDPKIVDVMPFIRAGYKPELRYTYKLNIRDDFENVYIGFGSDRKKDIKKSKRKNYKFVIDKENIYFDVNKAMVWEQNYGDISTIEFVRKYIKESIIHGKGMSFVALDENEQNSGGVHIVWDYDTAYILYSYYDQRDDDVAIAFLYHNIIKYLYDDTNVIFLDFEGSVFETIENWNISFGASQERFYNLHWKKNYKIDEMYDYGEK